MRVLVTGGAGFIGSHFVKRLVAAGDEVVVLDKLTYAGTLRTSTARTSSSSSATSPTRKRSRGRVRAASAVVNFAAETHVDRSILGPREVDRHEHHRRCRRCSSGLATPAGGCVQVSTDEVYGDLEAGGSSQRGRPAPPVEPVQRDQGRRRPPGHGLRPHLRGRRPRHARLEHVRAEPVSGEAAPALPHERARRRAAARCTATGARCATGCTSRITARASSSCCARARPGEIYNIGGDDERENLEITERILAADRRRPDARPPGRGPAGHDRRYSLDTSKLRALGWSPQTLVRRGRSARDRRLVSRQPRLVGADQVRRVPRATTRSSTQQRLQA